MIDRAGLAPLLRDTRVQRLLVANTLGSIGSGITIFSVPWLMRLVRLFLTRRRW